MKWTSIILSGILGIASGAAEVAEVAKKLLPKIKQDTITYIGDDGWLYSKNELEHLAAGDLTDGRIKQVSKATREKYADPIPAIVDFKNQLKEVGIQLIVMPVPPKLAVYPTSGLKAGDAAQYLQNFEKELIANGVEVLDLMPVLLAETGRIMYCKSDSHWSPAAIETAAAVLARRIGLKGNLGFKAKIQEIKITGDLRKSLEHNAVETECLPVRLVMGKVFDEASPVLLLGDSHVLVFSTGKDMLSEDAGLGEQLAYELQMPIDRIGVKGSASTSVRVNLYRKAAKNPAWLENKKFIVWVFTAREFTESTNGWAKVPVLRKKQK